MRFWKRDEIVNEVDPVVVEILARPASGEDAAIDAARKAGGDESVQKAVAASSRALEALRHAFGGDLTVDVAKAVQDQLGDVPTKLRPIEHEADDREDEEGADASDAGTVLTGFSKDDRSPADMWLEVAKIYRGLNERYAVEDLELAAATLRRRNPSLTREQAVAKALENNPDLYADMRRADLRKQGFDVDAIAYEPPPLDPRLEAAAAELRKADPKLTEAQAIDQALENKPSLYGRSNT